MAKGQLATKTTTLNNNPSTTASRVVELVVRGNMLVADEQDINPGVNTANLKN